MTKLSGVERLFKYKFARDHLLSPDRLTPEMHKAINDYFLQNDFKSWHCNNLVLIIKRGILQIDDQMKKIKNIPRFSREYFVELHGDIEGKRLFENHVSKAKRNFVNCNEYWDYRDIPKDDKIVKEHNKKASAIGIVNKNINGFNSTRSVKYWINKGYTLEEAKAQISKIQNTRSLSATQEKYGIEQGELIYEKRNRLWADMMRKIMEEDSKWRKKCDLEEFKAYQRDVIRYTTRSYKKFKYLVNPLDLLRGHNAFELDHKFSIAAGFNENISPEIIGHWTNLEMLPAYENASKWLYCSVDLQTLISNYQKYKRLT